MIESWLYSLLNSEQWMEQGNLWAFPESSVVSVSQQKLLWTKVDCLLETKRMMIYLLATVFFDRARSFCFCQWQLNREDSLIEQPGSNRNDGGQLIFSCANANTLKVSNTKYFLQLFNTLLNGLSLLYFTLLPLPFIDKKRKKRIRVIVFGFDMQINSCFPFPLHSKFCFWLKRILLQRTYSDDKINEIKTPELKKSQRNYFKNSSKNLRGF